MPHEDFVYLGDHARLPYGPRTRDEMRRFAHEIGLLPRAAGREDDRRRVQRRDLGRRCRTCRATLEVPVVGVIAPEAHAAVQATRNRRIGLLATELTVARGRYESLVRTLDAGARLHVRRVPEARAADRGGRHVQRRVVDAVREYAAPLKEAGCDTVILGCTHYPLIRPVFQRVFGRDVTLVFSADETAREVAETLARKGFENDGDREGAVPLPHDRRSRRSSATLGERFLQLPLGDVEHVSVAELDGRPRDAQRRPPARPAAAGRRRSRRSSSSRTASCSGRRARRASSARRRSRTACRAGSTAPGRGWMTAEYSLLPASTGERTDREAARGKQGGRTVEIQRLIGRALRGVVDFQALGERTVYLDCDVLQADGGTRCAAITGAYVAAPRALDRFGLSKALTGSVAAVSVGVVDGEALLDLDYSEDSNAEVDVNVVMTGDGRFVEVQSTAEQRAVRPRAARRAARPRRRRDRGARAHSSRRRSMLLASSVPALDGWDALLRLAVAAGSARRSASSARSATARPGSARICSSRSARRSSPSSRPTASTSSSRAATTSSEPTRRGSPRRS